MGASQRRKGKSGELEAARELSKLTGWEWRRSANQASGASDPDVTADECPSLWVEVKRGKAPRLWAALEQAKADARPGQVPVVLARRDRGRWVVVVELEDLRQLDEALWPEWEEHELVMVDREQLAKLAGEE